MRGGDQGDVAMPALPGAALEVVQAQAGLEFAIVVLDPPADLGIADEVGAAGGGGKVGEPVGDRFGLVVGPSGDEPPLEQGAALVAGTRCPAGRTRRNKNCEVSEPLLPSRQVMVSAASRSAAATCWTRLTGSSV